MVDRSISWRRTGGRTHVVTIDDGPLRPWPFASLQNYMTNIAAANVSNQGLQAAYNTQNGPFGTLASNVFSAMLGV